MARRGDVRAVHARSGQRGRRPGWRTSPTNGNGSRRTTATARPPRAARRRPSAAEPRRPRARPSAPVATKVEKPAGPGGEDRERQPAPQARTRGRRPRRPSPPRAPTARCRRRRRRPSRPAAGDQPTYTVLRGAPARTVANMDDSLSVPTATSVAIGPGQAALGQPDRHQQPPLARPRRQGVLHPPDRLRAGQGAQGDARDERRLRRDRRQADQVTPGPRQPRPRDRPARSRTAPAQLLVPNIKRAETMDFAAFWTGLRGHRAQGPQQQADRRGLPGHDDLADQPGHASAPTTRCRA